MTRTKFLIGGLLLALALSAAAQSLELKYLSSWGPNNNTTWGTEQDLMRMVGEESKGRLSIKRSGPEAVPPFEQLQPTGAGVFDLLLTHGAYHAGTTGIGMALDGIVGDPVKRRESGVWAAADKHYRKHGLAVIALMPQGKSGAYNILLRSPVGPAGDLKGLKIRGSITYHPLFKALGASPVVLAPADIYAALEKGLVDGAGWPVTGITGFKWQEVAKYYIRPSFGVATMMILMNANSFDRLSADDKRAMLEVGRKLELMVWENYEQMAAEELAEMKKAGMKEVRLSKAIEAKLNTWFSEGVWELAIAKNKKEAEDLRELVIKTKMSP